MLGIPKNLQIMRKEMKKGRMLILSLEESRNKFIKREQPEVRRERRGPFMPVGLSKMRAGARSSLSNFDYPLMSGISQQMESGPSQLNLGELRAFGGEEGL